MLTRRTLLASTAAFTSLPAFGRMPPPPVSRSGDADYWAGIRDAFDLDPTMINLNNGGCCPSPRIVQQAYKEALDISNLAPSYTMWQQLEPGVETVRTELAREAGCDRDELAITRNASEALQIAQMGIPLQAGDEVITTDQDYPRMLTTWDSRARRDGIVVRRVTFPVPLVRDEDLLDAIGAAITPRTRVIHVSHAVFLTGQILPVDKVCALARKRGILSIVDGAHAFAHVPVDLRAMDCDYYGTSLHKWLLAPVGTGFLYVKRDRIAQTWPLQAAPEAMDGDIRKFEEIGTHPAAAHNAVAEALTFHRAIGMTRKHDRLVALRRRWSDVLRADPRFVIHTPDDPARSGAIGLVELVGREPADVVQHLWADRRIFVVPISHAQFQGVRVSPNVYTSMDEIDRFTETMQRIAQA